MPLEHAGQRIGDNIVNPTGMANLKFKGGQAQQPSSQTPDIRDTFQEPAKCRVVTMELELFVFQIGAVLFTAEEHGQALLFIDAIFPFCQREDSAMIGNWDQHPLHSLLQNC